MSKTTSQSSKKIFTSLIFFLFFLISLPLIILLFLTFVTFLLLSQNIIRFVNPNKITIPEGMNLLDLNILTYQQDHSLYRLSSHGLVLQEDDEFETVVTYDDETGHKIVLMTTPHVDPEFQVSCSGTCNCYEEVDGDDDERRISNMIYSSRFASVVVVSILGFATAKFVDGVLEECYDKAKGLVNAESDDHSSISTCSVERVDCKTEEAELDIYKDLSKKGYVCTGHCAVDKDVMGKLLDDCRKLSKERPYLTGFYTTKGDKYFGIANHHCQSITGGEKNIRVPDFQESEMSMEVARSVYRLDILSPICEKAVNPTDLDGMVNAKYDLCTAYESGSIGLKGGTNVQCRPIEGESSR